MRRIAFVLAAATGLTVHSNSALADTGPCHSLEYERTAYAICEVDLHKHTVRLYWKRWDGTPYAYLSTLPRDLEGGAGKLVFATNAGMFDPSPSAATHSCAGRQKATMLASRGRAVSLSMCSPRRRSSQSCRLAMNRAGT